MKPNVDTNRIKERPLYFLEHCLLEATCSGNAPRALQILSNFPAKYSSTKLALEAPSVFCSFVCLLDFGLDHVAELARILAIDGTWDRPAADAVRDEFFMASAAAGVIRAKQGFLQMSEGMFMLCAMQHKRTNYYAECLSKAFGTLIDAVSTAEAEMELEYPDCDTDVSMPAPCRREM